MILPWLGFSVSLCIFVSLAMMSSPKNPSDSHSLLPLQKPMIPRLAFSLLLFIFLFLINFYILYFFTSSHPSPCTNPLPAHLSAPAPAPEPEPAPNPNPVPQETGLQHVVFGIGSSQKYLPWRGDFIRLWWRPNSTRGFIFLDHPVNLSEAAHFPQLKVSDNTSHFGHGKDGWSQANLRMTWIVSDLVRMRLKDVRWFVMGDDDTMFYPDNLVRVLKKYDHTRMYYIGSNSETHLQNIKTSSGMAFGGAGFAISYPLANKIERMLDGCTQRYPEKIGLDDRIHTCISELGVPLTREPGFHQVDLRGDLFGLLAAHPVTPLVTIHHFELVNPIFPSMNRLESFIRLSFPAKVDSAGLMQQSICYDPARNWTVSVSWGYAVQIIRGWISAHEMERPARTFYNWGKNKDPRLFSFNTRPWSKHPCEEPYVYFFNNVVMNTGNNVSWSEYMLHRNNHTGCFWKVETPEKISRVEVYKIPNPHKWDQAPRRDCCRVLPTEKEGTMVIDVGECEEGEIIAPQIHNYNGSAANTTRLNSF